MAIFTGTDISYNIGGASGVGKFNREDLSDLITNISPTDRPFVSRVGKGAPAKSIYHEWLTDELRAAAENAQLEGDEYAYTTNASGTRIGAYCQILRDTIIVSGTQDAVDKAGMKKWMAYQVAKASKELANDLEWACLNNTATVQGDSSTARKMEGVCSNGTAHTGFIATNVIDKDGTVSQTDINLSMQNCWTYGGRPTFALMGAFNKRNISTWTTGVVKNLEASKHVFTDYVDVYETDFGNLELVLDHFIPADAIYMIEPRHWSLHYLRPLQVRNPSETGDATKYAVLMEVVMECRAEKANAAIVDTSTS